MPNVSFVRDNIKRLLPQWELIRDCIAGQEAVKARKQKYLPMPNPEDDSDENTARYHAYLTRALFYNVSQRTLAGLVGQVFMRDPIQELPTALEPMIGDATGSGISLDQSAQLALNFVLPYGRCGLFVDFPDTGGAITAADTEEGKFRPTLTVVPAIDCINYRTEGDGALKKLTLVVFREDYIIKDDGFETKCASQWVALRLVNGVYIKEVYRERSAVKPFQTFTPKDAKGNTFDFIPFVFIGALNNDPEPDLPPLYDLCAVNIAHYRNSADYEEAVYMMGQPTLAIAGLTQEWAKTVLKGKVMLGARGGIMLPVGATAELLQVEANTMAKEAMDQKEAEMVALGAKLVEASQTERTATEADHDNVAETSVLSTASKNVGMAFKQALEWACRFAGAEGATVEYELNTEFDLVNLSPEERKQTLAEWQAGAITFTEMRDNLRRAGVATLDDEEAQGIIAEEQADLMAMRVEEAGATAEAGNVAPPLDPNIPAKAKATAKTKPAKSAKKAR